MKKIHRYMLTFSTERLVQMLSDAGFSVEPPRVLTGSLVRFVSCPEENTIEIEARSGPTSGWERVETVPAQEREMETVRPGQYL